MNKFGIQIYMTTSKLAAYIILVIGSVFAFWFHDGGVLLATFSAVSAILMLKTYTTSKTDQKQMDITTNSVDKKQEDIG
jgi:hypothetical protein